MDGWSSSEYKRMERNFKVFKRRRRGVSKNRKVAIRKGGGGLVWRLHSVNVFH